ncbi:MAG: hypothetical protein JST28_22640 [Acidobacteria bacterium]|nr:hypothetical protein [Acidobacteriota bacterium]
MSAPQPVTVAQLVEIVENAKGISDETAAKEIGQLELTERLSSLALAGLIEKLSGAKSKTALMAVGDASVFLECPKSEVLSNPTPDPVEQRRIMARASDYLNQIVPKLPDFYAKRITTAFKVAWVPKDKLGTHNAGPLDLAGRSEATVLYRNGKEVVQAEGAAKQGLSLNIVGTFGPILAKVINDNLQSPMLWHGWEKGPNGALAVFQFHVSMRNSHYSVSLPMAGLGARRVGYNGEICIDPETGTILRLAIRSDPALALHAFEHADIMLEYGPVSIGGKSYICPVRGVSISRASYQEVGIMRRDRAFVLLNDMVFTDYHVFRSDIQILPE